MAVGVALSAETMVLSKIGKTVDSLGFAYFELTCVGKEVGSIEILEQYPHLRQIDLSKNSIQDVGSLAKLENVLKVNLSVNRIESISCWGVRGLPYLLYLDLSGNMLTSLPRLNMKGLREANFARNRITSCVEFQGHPSLEKLCLSENRLEEARGICNSPLLKVLELASNSLTSIAGLCSLPALVSLDISQNNFENLEGNWGEQPLLEKLTVTGNKIATLAGVAPIGRIGNLKSIEVSRNPMEELEGVQVRLELLIYQKGLTSINAEPVAEEEQDGAKALHERKLEEMAEKKRLEAEAAEAAAAAEAEKAAAEAEKTAAEAE